MQEAATENVKREEKNETRKGMGVVKEKSRKQPEGKNLVYSIHLLWFWKFGSDSSIDQVQSDIQQETNVYKKNSKASKKKKKRPYILNSRPVSCITLHVMLRKLLW